MRKLFILAIAVLIATGVWFLIRQGGQPIDRTTDAAKTEVIAASSPLAQSAAPAKSVSPMASSPGSGAPRPKAIAAEPSLAPPDEAARIEVDKISLMLRDYRTIAGENPVGTNAEIMTAVMGRNPKQATLGPPEGMHLNEKGELIDRWGTPYFFHQLSRNHMEIRSAGADHVLWTADDPVIK